MRLEAVSQLGRIGPRGGIVGEDGDDAIGASLSN